MEGDGDGPLPLLRSRNRPHGPSGGSIHIRSFVRSLTDLGHTVYLIPSSMSDAQSLRDRLPATLRPARLAGWNRLLARAMQSGNRMVGRTPREHPDLVRILHNLTFRRAARRAAREAQPDFIYERYSLWGVAGLRLARDLGVPLVLEVNAPLVSEQQQYRGLIFPALARRAERAVYRGADLLVAVSEPLGDHLAQAGADRARIRILPNAVDTS